MFNTFQGKSSHRSQIFKIQGPTGFSFLNFKGQQDFHLDLENICFQGQTEIRSWIFKIKKLKKKSHQQF